MARLDWTDRAADVKWSIAQGKLKGRPPTVDQQKLLDEEPSKNDAGICLMANAYVELSTTRQISGFGSIGPIPVTAIWQWADRRGLEQEPAERFKWLIMEVDAETLRRARASK